MHSNLLILLLFNFIMTNSSIASIRITQFPSFFKREKGKFYFRSPRTNSSGHHCQTGLFPQVYSLSFFGHTRSIPRIAAT